jgi:copper chaperone CopZ
VVVRHSGERSLRVTVTAGDEVQLIAASGAAEKVLASTPLTVKGADVWHSIEVKAVGMRVRVTADGVEVIDVLEPSVMAAGHVEVFAATSGAVAFDDLTVTQLPPPLTAVLQVQGMTCELCEAKIEGAVKAIKGVKDAKASHATGVCFVELETEHPAEVAELVKAIEGKKYKVTLEGA